MILSKQLPRVFTLFCSLLAFVGFVFAETVEVDPMPNAHFVEEAITSLDTRGLTVAIGMAGRGIELDAATLEYDREREKIFTDTMIRNGVDMGISLISLDPGGVALATTQGLVTYLGYQAGTPPERFDDVGGVQVLTLAGPGYLPGLGRWSEQTSTYENDFLVSYSFNYDPLSALLSDLNFRLGQPTVYEVDGFRMGAAVAVDSDDRIVAGAPGLKFNFWMPPDMEGGLSDLFRSGTNYPYSVGMYGAYDTASLQELVGQMKFDEGVGMNQAVNEARLKLAEDVANEEGLEVEVGDARLDSSDAIRARDGAVALSPRLSQLIRLGSKAVNRQPSSANPDRVASRFRGSLSRVSQTAAFQNAGKAVGVLERAFLFVDLFDAAVDLVDFLSGGGVSTPARLEGSPHPTGLFDTLVPVSHLEWAGVDPTLHWQRMGETEWPGSALSVDSLAFAAADPRRAGHRSRTGYSLATGTGVLAMVSNFESRRDLSVLDLYVFDESRSGWVPMPAAKPELMEAGDAIRARLDGARNGLSQSDRDQMTWEQRTPSADFAGEAKQTVVMGNDVYILREQGGLLWFPERLRPDRDTFMEKHVLARNTFYRGIAHAEGYGRRIASNPEILAPTVMTPVDVAFRDGRFPIALADWDGNLGGSLAAARDPRPEIPSVAFAIPGARDGKGLVALLSPAFTVEKEDRFIGEAENRKGYVLEQDGSEILLPPRILPGANTGSHLSPHRMPYYGIEFAEVPAEAGPVSGLGNALALTSRFLVASDHQNRLHLWFYDGRQRRFVYSRVVQPEYRLEGRTVQSRGTRLAFTGDTLVGVDRMTDGSEAVWSVRLSADAEIRVTVNGDPSLFPEDGVPVSLSRRGEWSFGRDTFTANADEATLSARIHMPEGSSPGRELEFTLRLFGKDGENQIGQPSSPFENGTLRVYQVVAGEEIFLGEANRISEEWWTPGVPASYLHVSEWSIPVEGVPFDRNELIVRYAPGVSAGGNHGDILQLLAASEGNESDNRLTVRWIQGAHPDLRVVAPGETAVFQVPGDREYVVSTGRSYESNTPIRITPFTGDNVAVDLNLTGFDGKIYGVLVSADDQQVGGIPLAIWRDGAVQSQTVTDPDGTFTLPDAFPGGQDVITLLEGPFSIRNGEGLPPGDVRLVFENNLSFTETLRRSNGEPVAGMQVRITNFNTRESSLTTTDENGEFGFQGFLPGFYYSFEALTRNGERTLGSLIFRLENNVPQRTASGFQFTFPVFEASVELRNRTTGDLIPLDDSRFSVSTLLGDRHPNPEFPGELLFAQGRALLSDLDRRSTWVGTLALDADWFLVTLPESDVRLSDGGFVLEAGLNQVEAVPFRTFTGQLEVMAGETWDSAGLRLILSGEPTGFGRVRHFLTTVDESGSFSFRAPDGIYSLGIEGGFRLENPPAEIVVGPDVTSLDTLTARLDENTITGEFVSGFPDEVEVSLEWDGGSMILDVASDGRFTSPPLDPRVTYTQWIQAAGFEVEALPPLSSAHRPEAWRRYRVEEGTGERILLEEGETTTDPIVLGRRFSLKDEGYTPWSLVARDSATGQTIRPANFYIKWMPQVSQAATWRGAFQEALTLAGGILSARDYGIRYQRLMDPSHNFELARDNRFSMNRTLQPGWSLVGSPSGSPTGTVVAELDMRGIPEGSWTVDAVLSPDGIVSTRLGVGPDGRSIVTLDGFEGENPNARFDVLARVSLDNLENTVENFPVTVRVNATSVPYHLGIVEEAGYFESSPDRSPFDAGLHLSREEQYAGDPNGGVILGYIVPGLEVRDPAPTLEILDPSLPFTVSAYGTDDAQTFTLRSTALLDYEQEPGYNIPLRITDANGVTFESTVHVDLINLLDPVRAVTGAPELKDAGGERWFEVEISDIVLEDDVPQALEVDRSLSTGTSAILLRDFSRQEVVEHPSGDPTRRLYRLYLTARASGTHAHSFTLLNRQTASNNRGEMLGLRTDFDSRLPETDIPLIIAPVQLQFGPEPLSMYRRAVGQRLAVSVSIDGGTPPFTYQWYRDGEAVPGLTRPSLYFPSLRVGDGGVWQLEVTNDAGSRFSSSITIQLDLPGDLLVWGPRTTSNTVSVQVPQTLTDVVRAVTSRDGIGVAVQADGSLANFRAFDNDTAPPFWNSTGNVNQQLIRDRLEALEVLPAIDQRVVDVAAGAYHFVALTESGDVRAWGENDAGQTAIPPDLPAVKSVHANGSTSGAILLEGGIRLWGVGASGFNQDFDEHGTDFVDLSFPGAGDLRVLALRGDGTVFAWPSDGPSATGMPADLGTVLQVLQTSNASYAVLADGSVRRWGDNALSDPLPVLPALATLRHIDGRLFAYGRQGEMHSWRELDFDGSYSFLNSYDWTPPGLASGESLQTTLDAGISLRQVGILRPTAPGILAEMPPEVKVPLGGTLRLEVQVNPSVLPRTYTWFKDDEVVPGATGRVLQIPSFSAAETGSYRLTVANDFGEIESTPAVVTVLEAPVWSEAVPERLDLPLGSPLSLESPADGDGPISYAWAKDGSIVSAADTASFLIPETSLSDSGLYTVTARNAGGTVSRDIEVEIVSEPRITPTSPRVSAVAGQTLVLRVAVGEVLPTTYQWSLNGTPLVGATDPTLELAGFTSGQAGEYTLVATNEVGTSEVTITVDLRSAGYLTGWGQGLDLPPDLRLPETVSARADILQVAAASDFAVALDLQGTLHPWGNPSALAALPEPVGGDPFIDVVAGDAFIAALTRQGVVRSSDPALAPPSDLGRVVRLAAGDRYLLALQADGTVRQWGDRSDMVMPGELTDITDIATGSYFAYALRADGTVIRWHVTDAAIVNEIPSEDPADPVVGIAAGDSAYALLHHSGSVTYSPVGELNLREGVAVREVAVGDGVVSLLYQDGVFTTTAAVGFTRPVPVSLPDGLAVAAGGPTTLAIVRADQGPLFRSQGLNQYIQPGESISFTPRIDAVGPVAYQWHLGGQPLPGATEASLSLGAIDSGDAGDYRLHATTTDNGATRVSNAYTLTVAPGGVQALRPGDTIQTRGPVTALSRDGGLLAVAEEAGLFYVNLEEPYSYFRFLENYFAFKPYNRVESPPDPEDGGLAAGTPPWGLDAGETVEANSDYLEFEIGFPASGVPLAIEAITDSLGRVVVPLNAEIDFAQFPNEPDDPSFRVLYEWSMTWPSFGDDWTFGGITESDQPNAAAYLVPNSSAANLAGYYTFRLQVRFQEVSPSGSVLSETVKWREINVPLLNAGLEFEPAILELNRPGGKRVTTMATGNNGWTADGGAPGQPISIITDENDPHAVSWVRYPGGFLTESNYFPQGGDLQTPSPVQGTAALGGIAYLATVDKLYAVTVPVTSSGDWSLASSQTWSLPLPLDVMSPADLVIHEGFLYAGLDGNGLHIFDLADPGQPRLVAVMDEVPVSRVTVVNGTAYIAGGKRIRIVDVTDPANPRELSRMLGEGRALRATDDTLFSIEGGGQVVFFDVSDPADPVQTGAFNYYDWLEVHPTFVVPRQSFFAAVALEIWRDQLIVGTLENGLLFFDLNAPPAIEAEVELIVAPDLTGRYLAPRVSGSLPMTYEWVRNGEVLADAPNEERLFLPQLDASTAGVYELIVHNPHGTVRSEPIIVEDPTPPVEFTWLPDITPTDLYAFDDAIIGMTRYTGHFIPIDSEGVARHTGNGNVNFGSIVGAVSSASDGQHLYVIAQDVGIYDGTWLWQYGTTATQINVVTQRPSPEDPNGDPIGAPVGHLSISPNQRYLAMITNSPQPTQGDPRPLSTLQIFDLAEDGISGDPLHTATIVQPVTVDIEWMDDNTLVLLGRDLIDEPESALLVVEMDGAGLNVSEPHYLPFDDYTYQLVPTGGDRILLHLEGRFAAYTLDRSGNAPVWISNWVRDFEPAQIFKMRPDPEYENRLIGYRLWMSATHAYLRLDLEDPEDPVITLGPLSSFQESWRDSLVLGPPRNMRYLSDTFRGFGFISTEGPRGNPLPDLLSVSATLAPGETLSVMGAFSPMGGGSDLPSSTLGQAYRFDLNVSDMNDFTFHYAWFRNGERIAVTYVPSLTIDALSLQDVGDYSVTITGTGGSASFDLPGITPAALLGLPDETTPVTVPEFTAFTDNWGRGTEAVFALEGEVPGTFAVGSSGQVTWTPGETEGGHSWTPDLLVTVNGEVWRQPILLTAVEVNHPPVSSRDSVPEAIRSRLWSYNLQAADSDIPAQTLNYEILEGPAGMDIGSDGWVVWGTPLSAPLGPQTVRIRISDGVDPIVEEFEVVVVSGNTPPRWVNRPNRLTVRKGESFSYSFQATDDEQEDGTLVFSLRDGPEEVTFNASGLLTWSPESLATPAGEYTLQLRVTDGMEPNDAVVVLRVLPALTSFAAVYEDQLLQHFITDPDLEPPSAERALQRFAFGQDPAGTDPDRKPELAIHRENQEIKVGFHYRQRIGGVGTPGIDYKVDGVRYQAAVSYNLQQWFSGPEHVEMVGSPVSNGDGTETVHIRARKAEEGESSAFIRLQLISEP